MINLLICGVGSKTGMAAYNLAKTRSDITIMCGVDGTNYMNASCDCPVYKSFDEVKEPIDIVLNFSTPAMLDEVAEYVLENNCILIDGTPGYTKKQREAVFASNYLSLGLGLMFRLCVQAARTLKNFDIEIIEKFYSKKINAPSNTTIALAESINSCLGGDRKIVVGRSSKRKGNEICIHCVRGGSMVGEHEILFIGEREIMSIKHETLDTAVYAEEALNIIDFMKDKENGCYNMKDYYKTKIQ